jgi:hypothetical protein
MERKRKLTVKIIGAKNDSLWYNRYIGTDKTFDVKVIQDKDYYEAFSKGHVSQIIYKEDCEVI